MFRFLAMLTVLIGAPALAAEEIAQLLPPDSANSELVPGEIRNYQIRLNRLGFNAGPPDGVLGKRTRLAIIAFQKSIGGSATGVLTEDQSNHLILATNPKDQILPVKAEGYEETFVERRLEIETNLAIIGIDPGEIDGIIDSKTISAFHKFQDRYDLRRADWMPAEQSELLGKLAKAKKEFAHSKVNQSQQIKQTALQNRKTIEPKKTVAELPSQNSDIRAVPVLERKKNGEALTCTTGTVIGLEAVKGDSVYVRAGPGQKYSEIDEISEGAFVYIFDKRGAWLGIVFGNEEQLQKVECTSNSLRKVPYEKSGWVNSIGITRFSQDDG